LKGNSHLYGTSWDFCGVLSIQNGKVNQQKWDIIVYPLWYNAGDVLGKPTAFYGYRVWQRRNPRFRQARVVIRKSSTVWSLGMIWNDNCLVFELIIWYSTLGTWNNICLMISVSFLLNNSCKLLDNCIYIFFSIFLGLLWRYSILVSKLFFFSIFLGLLWRYSILVAKLFGSILLRYSILVAKLFGSLPEFRCVDSLCQMCWWIKNQWYPGVHTVS
jgi:hypothetical protein